MGSAFLRPQSFTCFVTFLDDSAATDSSMSASLEQNHESPRIPSLRCCTAAWFLAAALLDIAIKFNRERLGCDVAQFHCLSIRPFCACEMGLLCTVYMPQNVGTSMVKVIDLKKWQSSDREARSRLRLRQRG
jgi:hypothetical protein